MYDPNAHGKENDAVVIPVYRTPRGKALIGIIAVCFFLMGGVVGGVVGGIVGHNKASSSNAFGGGISSAITQSSFTTTTVSQSIGSEGSGSGTSGFLGGGTASTTPNPTSTISDGAGSPGVPSSTLSGSGGASH